jgi:hypothetical protein
MAQVEPVTPNQPKELKLVCNAGGACLGKGTCLRLTFLCFLGSSSTSEDRMPPLLLNLRLPSRCFLLTALSLATVAAASSSWSNSTYHGCLIQSSLTAHPASSMCLQFPNLHLQAPRTQRVPKSRAFGGQVRNSLNPVHNCTSVVGY